MFKGRDSLDILVLLKDTLFFVYFGKNKINIFSNDEICDILLFGLGFSVHTKISNAVKFQARCSRL